MQRKELDPYVTRIMNLNLVNSTNFSKEIIQPIIDELVYFLYLKSNGGSKTDKKHVISQSLLRNFAFAPKRTHVNVNGQSNKIAIDDWMFCLPPEHKYFWHQRIENFFNFIEDHGADALRFFHNQLESKNTPALVSYNVNPLATNKETMMRLLLALYLAMHIIRQKISKRGYLISNADFLEEMKVLTASLFFYVWTWCKISTPNFIIPVKTPIVEIINSSKVGEYILPLSPTLALVVTQSNWDSFIMRDYIFHPKRTSEERSGMEDTLLCSSEEVGQQRFMIQTGKTTYDFYHSNYRLSGQVKQQNYDFHFDTFFQLRQRLEEIFPDHVRPNT